MNKRLSYILFFICFSIHLFSQVVASFSASPISGCAPLVAQFTDLSSGAVTTWSWKFGNSNTSSSKNPATIYSTPGVYSVTLTVTDGATTNTIVKNNYITVYNKPSANFTASSFTACIGQSILLTDATIVGSGSTINSWSWDFGDGVTQTANTSTVSHSYSTAGNYPISVITTDINGCTGTITKNITILVKPIISFTSSPIFSCNTPLNVNFTNTSITSGLVNYHWNFGDGGASSAVSPIHTYTSAGSYPVTLTINQNGCKDSITVPNKVVIQSSNVNFSTNVSSICLGQVITFTNTSVPSSATSNWNFGNGQTSSLLNPTYTYTAAGTYTVSLSSIDINSCSGNKTHTITVNPSPITQFSADTLLACSVPFTVNFKNLSVGASQYKWDFGDGSSSIVQNPIHTFTSTGTFTIKLKTSTVGNVCSDSLTKNNYIIIAPPVANFISNPDSGCIPLPVIFNNNSTSAVDAITNYIWLYGDGHSSSGLTTNPTNTYTTIGVFSPTLIAQTLKGCVDTFICHNCIKTGALPTSSFSIVNDTVCYGLPINFTDLSTGGATGWHWMFGDGASSPIQNGIHVYGDTGTYSVKLVVYNHGCSDTSGIKKVVVLAPKAVFTHTLNCTNYFTVNFLDASEGADSLVWDFGDGVVNNQNITNPIHTYTNSGTYNISLTAYNYRSKCSNVMPLTITIAKPIANFTVTSNSGCYPFTPSFTSTSQSANTYYWNFGDLSTLADTSLINNPLYTYNNPGTNTVSLIIKDVNGCKDSVKKQIQSLGPVPYFYSNILTGCRPLPVKFLDTTISSSPLLHWTWNFGDGTSATTTNNDSILHVYTTPGNYNVLMTVEDMNGCIKSIQTNNYIHPTFPYPAFSIDTFACKGNILNFDASTTNALNPIYKWDFGDGTTISSSNPISSHTYTLDNKYTITLKVTDANGCDSTMTDTIRILKPKTHFNWNILNAGCGNMQVAFKDSSIGYVNSWYWNFGNGANSVLQNPNYTYTQPGIFNVSLIVTNLGGCKDTLLKDSIIVVDGPIGTFSFSPNNGCNPLKVHFNAISFNAQNFIWDFGDGIVLNGVDSIHHTYNNQGTYNPVLILGNTLSNGAQCLLPATNLSGPVTVINSINVNVTPSLLILPEDSLAYINTSVTGGTLPYSYNWLPNSNISCNNCINPVSIRGGGNNMTYTFTVTDAHGCEGIDSIMIKSKPCIESELIPNIFSPNGDGINDVFFIPKICFKSDFSLQIFDRWGLQIYNTTSRNDIWDGKTSLGVDATAGTYFLIVKIGDKTYKNFIQLMR